jgi:hypothetical protein
MLTKNKAILLKEKFEFNHEIFFVDCKGQNFKKSIYKILLQWILGNSCFLLSSN